MVPDLRELLPRAQHRTEPGYTGPADPAMVETVCHHGLLYPFGPGEVTVWTESGRIRARLEAAGLRYRQDGDTEVAFAVPVSRLSEVVAIMKPRRRKPGASAEAMARVRSSRALAQSAKAA